MRSKIMPGILFDKTLSELSPIALQIIIDKPCGWEYRFFAELLKEYVEKYDDIRRDLLYSVSYGKRIKLEDPIEIGNWISQHFNYISCMMASATKLLNDGLPVAFGPPGKPGDARHIHYIAKRFTDGYKKLLEWRLDFLSLDVDDNFKRLLELSSLMAENAITEIEDYADHIYKEINNIFDHIDQYKEGTEIKLTLTLTAPDGIAFNEELERVKRLYVI